MPDRPCNKQTIVLCKARSAHVTYKIYINHSIAKLAAKRVKEIRKQTEVGLIQCKQL